eukprot:7389984-Prymnesium_polylepis.1
MNAPSSLSLRGSTGGSGAESESDGVRPVAVHIVFNDGGGILRVLELHSSARKLNNWCNGLKVILETLPLTARPSHWRWTLACMAATTVQGAAGVLPSKELRALLVRANASTRLRTEELEATLRAVEASALHDGHPRWLGAATTHDEHQPKQLAVGQVAKLLLHLCTASPEITQIFSRFAVNGQMSLDEWVSFELVEQVAAGPHIIEAPNVLSMLHADTDSDEQPASFKRRFEQALSLQTAKSTSGAKLSMLGFA